MNLIDVIKPGDWFIFYQPNSIFGSEKVVGQFCKRDGIIFWWYGPPHHWNTNMNTESSPFRQRVRWQSCFGDILEII